MSVMIDLWYLGPEGWVQDEDEGFRELSGGAWATIARDDGRIEPLLALVYEKHDVIHLRKAKRFPQDQIEAAKLWAELVFHGGATR